MAEYKLYEKVKLNLNSNQVTKEESFSFKDINIGTNSTTKSFNEKPAQKDCSLFILAFLVFV